MRSNPTFCYSADQCLQIQRLRRTDWKAKGLVTDPSSIVLTSSNLQLLAWTALPAVFKGASNPLCEIDQHDSAIRRVMYGQILTVVALEGPRGGISVGLLCEKLYQ